MNELDRIKELIHNNKHFLLSGGAGSGKTYTLVEVLNFISLEYKTMPIACITYTNAAVKEIERRVDNKNLRVSTIHDFIWNCISNFQNEIKACLIELINERKIKVYPALTDDENIPERYYNEGRRLDFSIQYKEYSKPLEGIISHDEVLIIAQKMYSTYPKLGLILKSVYPFIMVDEYQDTSKLVTDILLRHITPNTTNEKPFVIGFFGDTMQSIYDGSVGNLNEYLRDNLVTEVQKTQNRRNPKVIIELANKLRTDHLEQQPSNDCNAPNMKNGVIKEGKALFLFSNKEENNIDNVWHYLLNNCSWEKKVSKELNLTKNLIAQRAGFTTLAEIYKGDRVYKFVQDFKRSGIDLNEENTFSDIYRENPQIGNPRLTSEDCFQINNLLWKHLRHMYVDIEQLMENKTITEEEDSESTTGSKRSRIVKYILLLIQLLEYYHKDITLNSAPL